MSGDPAWRVETLVPQWLRLTTRNEGNKLLVPLNSIEGVEEMEGGTVVHTSNKEFLVRESFDDVEAAVSGEESSR